MTIKNSYGQESMNVEVVENNRVNGKRSVANNKITILVVCSKPRHKASRSRWPAIFVSMIMVLGIFTIMPVQAADTTTPTLAESPAPVNLGTAGDFVILAQSGITTTGVTAITGDIGVSPIASTAMTGFGLVMDPSGKFSTTVPTTLVTGKVYAANYADPTPSKMGTAVGDMVTAYNNAAGVVTPPPILALGAGDISTMTLVAGVYKWGTGLNIDNRGVTISGASNDVWIFQIAGTLTVANGAIVTLDGAMASNIFWQVAGQTTLGTTSQFKGIILDKTAIVIQNGASLEGRALAQMAVTTDANMITVPALSGILPMNQVTTLMATPHTNGGSDIQLEWTETPEATLYNIYESTSVSGTGFNFAAPTYTVPGDGVGKIVYQLTGKYADSSSYSWVVRAVNGTYENTDVPMTGGNMAYKLVKTLTIGTGGTNAAFNFIALPLRFNITSGMDINNAAALRNDMRAYGNPINSIDSIARWNSSSGDWDIRAGDFGTNFNLKAGEGYVAVSTSATPITYNIVGAHNNSFIYTLTQGTATTGKDLNFISLPYHFNIEYPAFTANKGRAWLNHIRAYSSTTNQVSSVRRWNQNTGAWASVTTATGDLAATNWPMYAGMGYVAVSISVTPITWKCPVLTPGP